MNIILLIFFAIPILVIVVSIALQKLLKCPGLVAAIIFAIFLVVTFIVGNLIFLVAAIIYAIISFITAVIICLIDRWRERNRCRQGERETDCCWNRGREGRNNLLTIQSRCQNDDNGNLLTISSNGCNGVTNDLLTINSNCNRQRDNSCCCNSNSDTIFADGEIAIANNFNNSNCECNNNSSNRVNARVNVIPNPNTNGRTGCICGNYRRRC